MSSEQYRRKIPEHHKAIARLHQEKGRESEKVAAITKKIGSASEAASKANTPSAKAAKSREIQHYYQDIAGIQKKIAGLESKIASEQAKLLDAEKNLAREEKNEEQARSRLEQKRIREQERRHQQVVSQLSAHDALHRTTMLAIEKISHLPERVVVLVIASNPLDQPQLRLDEEVRAISEMIRKSEHRDAVKLESCWAARPLDLLQAINEHRPRIVHFSGHGSNADEIIFQDSAGRAKFVTKEAIVQTMQAGAGDIQLVFFNMCFSKNQALEVVKHVTAAIGMNSAIGDSAARIFAAQFYSAIGFGLSVKVAFEQARAALMLEGIREHDIPELFVADGTVPEDVVLVRPSEFDESVGLLSSSVPESSV
ncbi:CHAT domain-containing protein [Sorangium sp. So ce118]